MLRVSVHRYRHQNTSLPEDMRLPPANFTRQMLSPVRESTTFGKLTESMPPDFPGRVDHATSSENPLGNSSPHGDVSMNSDELNIASTSTVVVFTQGVMTVTAEAGSPVTLITSPVAASTEPAPGTTSSLSTTSNLPSGIGDEDTATVPSPPSSSILWTTSSTATSNIRSSITTVPVPVPSSELADSPSTAQATPLSHGSSACNGTYNCAAIGEKGRNHDGTIVGVIVGVVAAIILALAVFMLRQWRHKRSAKEMHLEHDSAWHKISRSDGATSTATNVEGTKGRRSNKREDHNRDLGEPGPSFDFGEMQATNTKDPNANYSVQDNKISSVSTRFNGSFAPSCSIDDTPDGAHVPRSEIGVALSHYLTTDSTAPLSRPFRLTNCVNAPPLPKERVAEDHKRHSSISAQSDATIRAEDEVVYVGKARTARRHSLTPRVINIVAGGSSSDKINLGGNSGDSISTAQDILNRDSMRLRSMSPNKLLTGYNSFINGLADHLHKDTSDRTSIQNDQINRSSTTKTTVKDTVRYPVIPTRGRSMKRRADQHISYPPTSYPQLGKTMSEVKRTIREKGDRAFATSENLSDKVRMEERRSEALVVELPSSVTIARGGGRK